MTATTTHVITSLHNENTTPTTTVTTNTAKGCCRWIGLEEVRDHDDPNGKGFWVVVDSYVLDLTEFLAKHPSGARKIVQRRNKSLDISSNFLDHFGHTVRAFREACQTYERTGDVVVLKFKELAETISIIGKIQA